MIFTIIDTSNKIDIMLEIEKITKNNKNLIYQEYSNDLYLDLVFLYGGDGRYLEFIKQNIHKPIKIILMKKGKLSFLNSSYNYEEIDNNNFQSINYIEYDDGNKIMPFINECEIFTNKLNNLELYINKVLLKSVLSNRFFIFTSLGSTGLARSRNYPLLLNNDTYVFDVLDEPRYSYYQSLSQPLLLSINQNITLKSNDKIEYFLKMDNGIIRKAFTNEICIKNKVTTCTIYNAYNLMLLSKKIGELF